MSKAKLYILLNIYINMLYDILDDQVIMVLEYMVIHEKWAQSLQDITCQLNWDEMNICEVLDGLIEYEILIKEDEKYKINKKSPFINPFRVLMNVGNEMIIKKKFT